MYGIDNNHRYEKIKIKYERFVSAYEHGKYFAFCGAKYLIKEYPWPVTLFSLQESNILDLEDKISYDRFVKNISDYQSSNGCEIEDRNIIWGHKATIYIIDELKKGNKNNIIYFKTFQLLSEQKNMICNACEYLLNQQNTTSIVLNKLNSFIKKYKKVRKEYFLIKTEYIRLLIKDGKFKNMDYILDDKKKQLRIINMLEVAITKEDDLMIDLDFDSLDIVELITQVENIFDISFDEIEDVTSAFCSIETLCETIKSIKVK